MRVVMNARSQDCFCVRVWMCSCVVGQWSIREVGDFLAKFFQRPSLCAAAGVVIGGCLSVGVLVSRRSS
jgi:hypothetical protein